MSKTSINCTLRLVSLPFLLNHLLYLCLRGTFPHYYGSGMREIHRALLPCAMQMQCLCESLDSAKSGKWVGIREIPNSSEHLPFPYLHKLHVFHHTRSLFFLLWTSPLRLYSAIVRASTVTELHLRIRSRSRSRRRSCDEDSPHLRPGFLPLMLPSVQFGYFDIISAF